MISMYVLVLELAPERLRVGPRIILADGKLTEVVVLNIFGIDVIGSPFV